MNVTVFGTGYVGLVQAAVLAEAGHKVICIDIDENKIASLNKGQVPIYEPGLAPLVERNLSSRTLQFTTDAKTGVDHGEIIFIAVGTPPDEDGSADLRHVLTVARTIAEHMGESKIVVNKSTVPVGTADKVREAIKSELDKRGAGDLAFDVVSNPEFLKEGSAVADCMRPDRIIIGTDSKEAEEALRELYAPFNRNHEKIMAMDIKSAELAKYAANCMLATKISFMNEMAEIADRVGADIEQVRQGIGSDPRIGYHFIYAGIGYGGSCFPKDVKALITTAGKLDVTPEILASVEQRNERQKRYLLEKICAHFGDDLSGKTFALWGLAFKPNTDDMREAPSRVLMEQLWQRGARVQAFDPQAMEECQRIYGVRDGLQLCGTKESALAGADALIIATEWQQFKAIDVEAVTSGLKNPVIFDGRNLYDPKQLARSGIDYYCVGRPRIPAAR
ncbi:UDP-glucose dehydrogenase family protein [Microbulbifer thermotolerans]|uniref:UDP-glucose 6-dehydrogenase n=1 Tax=Microbulbifer thermotolerans TaxID=252514 RepID=A0A143HP63_MICTH|nr:UDP-glucose/GDP-mannose dehydrogenase family protein [Microbulbifer thermotolerans]AMX03524.1 UDP-glucose 6-dehydrogenase [Microbulbifer thermotolerans]MCX2778147.1 UDP-glucose/GDP-mannose dehydrogenase family protein [Microbulbifer thermotolerans]MCX2782219.1 UDP-glucose/GDP-mannose dehydrogenase family protein [Microbulbifer thermotolerans]MCX2795311.1 UDP-glucose/GDP-mannose dehydrogenase family protein [Microbulbifer thermotolerans]MCX2801127.1 UDP-glucose/GDP-mannose dehydrogenase fami